MERHLCRAGRGGAALEYCRWDLPGGPAESRRERDAMSQADVRADEIIRLMRERGGESYFGEPVSQLEHALQTAWFAQQASSQPPLIAAALLHDIGHLLHGLPE